MNEFLKGARKRIDKAIRPAYRQADKDIKARLEGTLKRGEKRANELAERYAARDITKAQYKQETINLMNSIGMRDTTKDCARVLTDADKTAIDAINAEIPAAVAGGMNHEAWEAEMATGFDEGLLAMTPEEIEEWMQENPDLFPIQTIDEGKDNGKHDSKLMTTLIASILLGVALDHLAGTVSGKITDDSHQGLLTFGLDFLSGEWGHGQDIMTDVEADHGLEPLKEWIATLDFKTRDAHRALDGQRVPPDEPFVYEGDEIWFPRDPTAPAYLRCNCRCAMRTVRPRFDKHGGRKENLRTPTGDGGWVKPIIPYMTYEQWYDWKRATMGDDAIKAQIRQMRREQRLKQERKRRRKAMQGGV